MMDRIGRYRVLRRIGQGGMAEVYEAEDARLGRRVAVKILLPETDGGARERLVREARFAANLHHPNIVAIHEVGEDEGRPYIVMDFAEGGTLESLLREKRTPQATLLRILEETAGALEYAHDQGVIHRDVKPGNILLDRSGHARLADFGLAKTADATRLTRSGVVMGTHLYLSPEQLAGAPADARTDVYALGVILYEILAGRPPFEPRTIPELVRVIPTVDPPPPCGIAALNWVCRRAMAKERDRRYPTARAFAEELERHRQGLPVLATPPSVATRLRSTWFRHRRSIVSFGLVAFACLAAAWIGTSLHRRGRVDELVRHARDHEEAGRWCEARECYEKALDLAGDHDLAREGRERAAAAERRRADEAKKHEEDRAEDLRARREALQLLDEARPFLERAERLQYAAPSRISDLRQEVIEARSRLERAVRLAPDLPIARYLLGCAWDLEGWEDRAEAEWKGAPDLALARARLGRLWITRAFVLTTARTEAFWGVKSREIESLVSDGLRELERVDEDETRQIEVFRAFARKDHARVRRMAEEAIRALGDRPGAEEFHFLLGVTASEGKVAHLNRALEICPGHVPSRYARSFALRFSDPARAMEDVTVALKLRPRFVLLYLVRSFLHRRSGDWASAAADLERAREIRPDEAEPLVQLAYLLRDQGKPAEAAEALSRALERDPRHASALVARAWLLLDAPEFAAALRDVESALEQEPDLATAWAAKGRILLDQERYAEALEALDRAVVTGGCSPEIRTNRGIALGRLKRDEEAKADYAHALEHDPRNWIALANRMQLWYHEGAYDAALADAEGVVAYRPEFYLGWLFRGYLRERKGNRDGAIADLEEALRRAPSGWPDRDGLKAHIEKLKSP